MKTLVLVFSLCFLSLNSTQAAGAGDVLINEIAWMGTTASYNDEWIELYNNSGSPVNLDGWVLRAVDGTPEIKLSGSFPDSNFYLLERSKDYTSALNNKGEKLELYDNLGGLVDSVDASSGWPAGNNSTKQTMERSLAVSNTANWQTSQEPGGTPATKNSLGTPEPKPIIKEVEGEPQQEPQIPQNHNPLPIPLASLIAVPVSLLSGAAILILKKKMLC